jgi:CheY-like chemotaxis protein
LKTAGASVVSCSSALQALAFYQVEPLDLIVSDIRMPGLDGYDLVRAIRANERGGDPRILTLAVTGEKTGREHERLLAAGYDAFLRRPVDPDLLLETVCRLWDREREGSPASSLSRGPTAHPRRLSILSNRPTTADARAWPRWSKRH